jgi:hypothetical protein
MRILQTETPKELPAILEPTQDLLNFTQEQISAFLSAIYDQYLEAVTDGNERTPQDLLSRCLDKHFSQCGQQGNSAYCDLVRRLSNLALQLGNYSISYEELEGWRNPMKKFLKEKAEQTNTVTIRSTAELPVLDADQIEAAKEREYLRLSETIGRLTEEICANPQIILDQLTWTNASLSPEFIHNLFSDILFEISESMLENYQKDDLVKTIDEKVDMLLDRMRTVEI